MLRNPRSCQGGYCYQVLNRGNGRRTLFHKDGDFNAFLNLLREAGERVPVRRLGNHFHLVLWPRADGDLCAYMIWGLPAHVRRYQQHYHSGGHVYQGRVRSFPIQEDDHLLTVRRSIERNPVRAGLVKRAPDWLWSSAAPARVACRRWTSDRCLSQRGGWSTSTRRTEAQLDALRERICRQRPLGDVLWTQQGAHHRGLGGPSEAPRSASQTQRGNPPSVSGDLNADR